MSLRTLGLMTLTLVGLVLVAVLVWRGFGLRRGDVSPSEWTTPDYQVKKENLKSLYREARRKGYLNPSEMEIVKKLANDQTWDLRVRALTALFPIRSQQQRQEVIQIALEKLKDPEWVVRVYALRVLAAQGAKEYVPQILPLLNDPQPEVREEVKKTFQKLGYQVSK
jgi:HEAT repeat protein